MSRIILVAAVVLCLVEPLQAGRGDKAGTAAASELLIPVGARMIGMGGASLATVAGVEAMYWNPAGLAKNESHTVAMMSHMSYIAGITVDYLGIGLQVPDLATLGFNVKSLSFGKIPITTEDFPDGTGEIASPNFFMVGGVVARQITDRIAIGFSTTIIVENMEQVSATGIAFSGGIQYAGIGGVDGLSFGVAVKNLGPAIKFDGDGLFRTVDVEDALRPASPFKIDAAENGLPSTIEIGLGYAASLAEKGKMLLTMTFQNNNYSDDEYKVGGEISFDDFLFVRGGYAFAAQSEHSEYIFGPSVGAGIATLYGGVEIHVDYAYRSVKYFSGNHVISLLLSF